MKSHVIDFTPDGQAQAMHRDDMNLSFLGRQSIVRATEIKFNEDTQKWDICYPAMIADDFGESSPIGWWRGINHACGFATYEGARQVEVEWLNSCRLEGVQSDSERGLEILRQIRGTTGL